MVDRAPKKLLLQVQFSLPSQLFVRNRYNHANIALTLKPVYYEDERGDVSQLCWYTPVIPTPGRLRQEDDHKFKVSLEYISRGQL